jgi:hypothetical protein
MSPALHLRRATVVALAVLGILTALPQHSGAAARPRLWLSPRADRGAAVLLDGQALGAPVAIFLAVSSKPTDTGGYTRVEFSVDGELVQTEGAAPFDLGGGTTAAAQLYDPTPLPAGDHVVTARARDRKGRWTTVEATFRTGTSTPSTTSTTSTTLAPTTTTTPTTAAPTTTTTAPVTDVTRPAPAGRVPAFASTSFWYQQIPSDVALHPSSAALVADFDRQWREHYGNVGINTSSYAPPIFVADADTPTRTVRFWDCQGKGYVPSGWSTQFDAVPVPADARPSPGTDAELVIHQPSTDTVWELWKARVLADGTWEACWGGRLQGVSRSHGVFGFPWGTTATGLSLAGGLITPEELEAGRIDHALAVSVVEPRRSVFSWPANRTDGFVSSESAIPEGLRLRLDPTIDVDSLDLTPAARIVARALQTYGMVVRDKSGSVTFYGENVVAEGRSDPYPALFGGVPRYDVLDGIPWHRLQALPMDYGRP